MEYFNRLKKLLQKISWLKHTDKTEPNPRRDWLLLLGIFFVMLAITAGVNFMIYQELTSGSVDDVATQAIDKLDIPALTREANKLKLRQATYDKVYAQPVDIVDPNR